MQIAIVVIAYNRIKSLKRLLNQLKLADYGTDQVTLIISIDKSDRIEVEKLAYEFEWQFGRKIVKTFHARNGLKKHVLMCGNYMEEYGFDAEIVFEDDIFPAVSFYQYAKQALKFYEKDVNIAGISLYQHLFNPHAQRPFVPVDNGKDVFFMQMAQSWGQAYTKHMWSDFYKWYMDNQEFDDLDMRLPQFVMEWPESSWLKYYIKYCVYNNKFFVYPYLSQCTCFSEIGENATGQTTVFQVPIQVEQSEDYCFDETKNSTVYYDVFFERIFDSRESIAGIKCEDICIDLYGLKSNRDDKRYWLTTKVADYCIVETYGLQMRPQELNVIYEIEGNQIFLYDTTKEIPNDLLDKKQKVYFWEYDTRDTRPDRERILNIIRKHTEFRK